MKKILLFVALILTASMQVLAQGQGGIALSDLGIKGEVVSFHNNRSGLTVENGRITSAKLGACTLYFNSPRQGNVYHGTVSASYYNDGTCKVHVTNGKISKLEINLANGSDKETIVYTYTYGKGSFTSKMNGVATRKETYYVDYTDEINRLQSQINALIEEYGHLQYSFSYYDMWANAYKKIQKLEKKIRSLRLSEGTKKTRTVTAKTSGTNVYNDFVYDDLGNVTNYKLSWNFTDTENRKTNNIYDGVATYGYDPIYLGEFYWNKLKDSDDLEALEGLYLNEGCKDKYRKLAEERWNGIVMSVMENKYKNNTDTLIAHMKKEILSEENYSKMSDIVGATFYPKALAPRDYNEVYQAHKWAVNDVPVFNKSFRKKIIMHSEKLRADSVVYLNNKTKKEIQAADYGKAIRTANGTLKISPNDTEANTLLQDGHYKLLMKNVEEGNRDLNHIEALQRMYPEGKYKTELEDERAKYYLSELQKLEKDVDVENAGGDSLLSLVRSLPVNDTKLAKELKKTTNRKEFIYKRGDVLDFGLGVNAEYGKDMFGVYGEAGFRIGYLKNFVNLYVGGRFGWMTSMTSLINSDKAMETVNGGHFEMLRASVPVQLRLHLAKGFNSAFYLGLGADINFNINPKVKIKGAATTETDQWGNQFELSTGLPLLDNTVVYKDKNLVNKMTYSPRVSLGYTGTCFNFEVYGLYDLKDTFNKEYLENNFIQNIVHPQFYKEQVENKWRVGLALRLFF